MAKYSIVHSVRVCTEFTPETFGRLTTLGPKFRLGDAMHQVCMCKCGIIRAYRAANLRKGNTKSCGCRQKEIVASLGTKHGMRGSPAYNSWATMKARCDNSKLPRYSDHGGRGITYCVRWKKFENFYADMGDRPSLLHTLDRFPDKNGNYEPSNCRWATPQEQANNTRRNHLITIDNKQDTLANWCRFYGIGHNAVVGRRLARGWKPIDALTTPIGTKK